MIYERKRLIDLEITHYINKIKWEIKELDNNKENFVDLSIPDLSKIDYLHNCWVLLHNGYSHMQIQLESLLTNYKDSREKSKGRPFK